MDTGYELYCLTDPQFYDSAFLATVKDEPFPIAGRELPSGWRTRRSDDWLMCAPAGVALPAQGWKIHASACLDNAELILEVIWEYCTREGIAFKFIPSRQLLFLRNMKYASRGYSGKFVTIFPTGEDELERVLNDLAPVLSGYAGPYILSDLRWGDGPLYVRYGAFAERYCVGTGGELEPAVEDGEGNLVPDRRNAVFTVPAHVALPACLDPHLRARNSATMADLPYRVERALHFSNGGGVYAGVDTRTNEQIVLKEARPHAGLGRDEKDAVARLGRERETLERLAGLDIAPALRDYFIAGGHHFLVMDLVAGQPLNHVIVERYPLISSRAGAAEIAAYTSWALAMCERIERAVAAMHARGLVIGDLHPSNVLVEADGRVVLIDLELASHVSEKLRPPLADPGFGSPGGVVGFDIDNYALACLRLYIFLPLTRLLVREPAKTPALGRAVAELFPDVPAEFLDEAVSVITAARPPSATPGPPAPAPAPDPLGWDLARESMARAILASATPERDDRLFPGDPKQFHTSGLNLAYGAAGVLHALSATGAGCYPEGEEWLIARALKPERGTRLGFYDGLHGVAYALAGLDYLSEAQALLDICADELEGRLERLGLDLYSGLAGIGLNLTHLAGQSDDATLWRQAARVAEAIADRLGDEDSVPELSGREHPYAGLLRGSSGPALFFLRLYEHFGDPALLDYAEIALRQDLRRCIVVDDGTLQVNEGWRTMPYLADGSVGIGWVLEHYLSHREDERFATAAAAIAPAARCAFYIEPGLFWGRAGMILYLSRDHAPGSAVEDTVVASHIRRLAWHASTYAGHLAFPGEELLRLSMDLATGTAGVLLALGAALCDEPVSLPFLRSAGRAERGSRPVLTTVEGR
ncbi:MAG TPA: class III lanthionine synthetase LanKC [Solirubrobacteraceae bacterium]|nr:class III lanthionine synthetase LanKC [Solirubrobacteraceae bacterium]